MVNDRMTSTCHLIAMGDCPKTNSAQTFDPRRLAYHTDQHGGGNRASEAMMCVTRAWMMR